MRTFRAGGVLCAIPPLLLCALLLGASRADADSPQHAEYEVKAAYLYNFAKFVEWPKKALPEPDTPIVIGVLGEDPFRSTLDEAVKGKKVGDRALEVRRSGKSSDLEGCHIVFISSSEKSHLSESLAPFKGKNVLTVGDTEKFAEGGGVINLVKDKNKVRFEINVDVAKEERLKISSQLLKLAKIVRRHGSRDK